MLARPTAVSVLAVLLLARVAHAADASNLKPPPGAKVAIVAFEDLQCSDSARAYPLLLQAASAHHIPLVLRAFPLPMHNWAFDAEAWAAFFDQRSEKLGGHFRDYVYANQNKITFANLRQFVQKFADQNKVSIPAAGDLDGALAMLATKVKADFALGQQIGLVHSPTVFIVGTNSVSAPLVESVSYDELNRLVEDMLKRTEMEAATRGAASKNRR